MAFQRLLPFVLLLPFLAGCNQTAAPEAPPSQALPGSGAMAAILDVQQTQAQHSLTATMANHAASLDRSGTAMYATKAMYEEQARIQGQKVQRMMSEVNKLVEEAEALGELNESMERQKASSAAGSRRKTTP